MRTRVVIGLTMALIGVLGVPSVLGLPAAAYGSSACERSARLYETRCLMPRIEARMRFSEDGDATGFVTRMREIDHTCADVTATGLAGCVAWPRVRPTAMYRRWLRHVHETWERLRSESDGTRPACPPGVQYCL